MIECTISEAVRENLPMLESWLASAWIKPVAAGAATVQTAKVLMAAEIASASHRDILIDFRDGAPSLVRAANGLPARIAFGFDDMALGLALVAELLRAGRGPAVGEPAMAKLMGYAARIARSEAAVLIQGETGTGKEGMARLVHDESPRAKGPFIAVNCAALPETMVEAILFGHKKGAFTGASADGEGLFRAADGGTLFLDEITELPLALQAKLLRALQEGEVLPVGETRAVKVDVRIVTAANRDAAELVAAGEFREDLYWRLNVMPIALPRLADRRQDVRAIAAAMLLRMQNAGDDFAWLSAEALETLQAHSWPGNARELGNVLQRALVLREGDAIEAEDLGLAPVRLFTPAPVQPVAAPQISTPRADPVPAAGSARLMRGSDLHSLSRAVEHDAIQRALDENGGNRRETAKMLGISERTLRYRLANMRELAAAA
ncbi:MAG: sigma-54-dependent Fis family transcriptional regulator [Sphingomonadales bacterium RIFCSPHIGHO2_01_FULL_65_20]|jgi:two-component system response regulator FlrC|uniref:AAA family ATPase n=1 Tax=Sphingomonas ursincola TaxID=56361 RepID=A0A7V8UAN0_9SPHN|nr:sigma 54-interacting transcriptional regulator [Sphingomonas ursincola]MBA1376028.1 AAA family ATPase [Sphingomonas ursincola]MCH2238472.1 sigma 54-interacting transcriptional regulator [Blastomonas sp.]OHC93958.1 MAG: sigma-54-dependent Fis family transcriptional regulator [Sphingomonadales bacterium RIFCSPHIGHO2_01_FULL_65_20]